MKRFAALWLSLFAAGIVFADNPYPLAGGSIVRLEPTTKQITIKNGTNLWRFAVSDQTYLFNGTEKLSFDKLKLGDPVKLNYYTNGTGQALIRRLKIDHPPTDPMVDKAK